MGKVIRSKLLWIISTSVLVVLLIAAIIGAAVANVNSAALNAYFDLLPYKIVKVGEDEEIDTEYYKSAFVTNNGNYDDLALWDYDLRVAQQLVNEGSVLLWNNNEALPLTKGAAVSCFGNTSVNMVYTGTGSGSINIADVVNLREGLEQYEFRVNDKLWDFYADGAGSKKKGYGLLQKGSEGISTNDALYTKEVPWNVITADASVEGSFAQFGDSAIFVLGRSGGEGGDLRNSGQGSQFDTIGGDYLQLSSVEREVLDKLVEKKESGLFGKVILLINSANAMQMDLISGYSNSIDACLWVGQPGAGGAPGIAKLLCGDATPSGHLVDTYCYDNDSSPVMKNFYTRKFANAASRYSSLGSQSNAYEVYQEGIYVGYRYYETRYEDVVLGQGNAGDYDYSRTVAYPFGYGLSYTKFSFDAFDVKKNGDGDYEVSVKVTNTGKNKGRQVAQIYLQKPYTEYDITNHVEKAAVELCGYAKTANLESGASEILKIVVDDRELTSYDCNQAQTFIRQAKRHYFAVGENAHDALNNILAAKAGAGVTVDQSKMTDAAGLPASGNASLVKSFDFDEIDAKTYAVSAHTGAEISNRFDFADINKYENNGGQSVEYVTRNDWTGTLPDAAPTLNLNDAMVERLAVKRDLAPVKADADAYFEKYGAIKYGVKNGFSLIGMKDLPWNAPEWDKLLDQMSWDEQAELCSNGYHTSAAVESIDKPPTRDENGPLGISVTFSTSQARRSMGWPCEPVRAATFNKPLSELFGRCLGEDMMHAGVTGLWGFGLNIHRSPYSGRNFEYYSEDSFLSGEVCSHETIGTQSKGRFVMVKHFALNDFDTNRHGVSEWLTEQTLREIYLRPFEKEFTEGKAWATMTSYNRIGNEWAGGCYALLTTVLRNEWGYRGFCSSDFASNSTPFMNPYIGIQAGCDTYDANFHKDKYDGLQDDEAFRYCLRMSSKRICYAILHTGVMNGLSSGTRVVIINAWWQNALIALQVGLGVLAAGSAAMSVLAFVRKKRSDANGGEL